MARVLMLWSDPMHISRDEAESWLLELHLTAGSDPARSIDDPLLSDWLGDLHLLGMRPVVLLTAATVP